MRSLVKNPRESSIHARLQKNQIRERKKQSAVHARKSCNAESIFQEKVMVNIGYHRRIA
jgi:hypothetical protein